MQIQDLRAVLRDNTYPGRGIVLGKSADGQKAVIAYFIMGRSANSRNRVFTAKDGGIITEAADPSKLEDREVTLGRNDESFIEVLSGLEEGETVFIQNAASANPWG